MRETLRAPGAVLLISCYELGHAPLAVASPAAFLEREGFAPAVLDIALERLDEERVRLARLVAISVPMHTALRLGMRVAERVRALNPGAHVVLYGLYATLNAAYLLDHGADSTIGGECEEPLVALALALDAGRDAHAVPGVVTKGAPARPHLARLPFAVPSRAGLPPLDRYAKLERPGGDLAVAGYTEASRGCLHRCLHCPIPPVYGGRFFIVPRAVVLEDVRRLAAAGARHVTFGDPDFLNGPRHALEVLRAAHAEHPHLTFDVTTKVEHILRHRRLVPDLAAAGVIFIVSAVESLSDTVLANLEKGHTRADVFEALRIVRGAGLALRPTWVPFTPWTTRADYIDILDLVESEDLVDHVDSVQYAVRLLVPPGSALLARAAIRPFLGALDEAAFVHRWTHPDPSMDALQRSVAALVEEAARAGERDDVTFRKVRALADPRAARAHPAPARDRGSRRAPRLTEPWFC